MSNVSKITFTEEDNGDISIEAHIDDAGAGMASMIMLGVHSLVLDIDMEMLKNLIPDDDKAAQKIYRTIRNLRKSE